MWDIVAVVVLDLPALLLGSLHRMPHARRGAKISSCLPNGNIPNTYSFIQATHFKESVLSFELAKLQDAMDVMNKAVSNDPTIIKIQMGYPSTVSCDIYDHFKPKFFIKFFKKVSCNVTSHDGVEENSTIDIFLKEYDKRKSGKKLKVLWPCPCAFLSAHDHV